MKHSATGPGSSLLPGFAVSAGRSKPGERSPHTAGFLATHVASSNQILRIMNVRLRNLPLDWLDFGKREGYYSNHKGRPQQIQSAALENEMRQPSWQRG